MATRGDYCKTHQPAEESAESDISTGGIAIDDGLLFEFVDVAREVWRELKALDIPPGARPQYWGIIVNCLKHAKEEMRRDAGRFTVYHVVHEDPLQPKDDVPPLPELPLASEGDG
jgi:hypothetical protein